MTTYNFETATAVKYFGRDITKVYLGSVMIWPIHHNVTASLDAKGQTITDNIKEVEQNDFLSGPLVELKLPHNATEVSVDIDYAQLQLMDLLNYRNLIITSSLDDADFYGHNKYQSDSEGDSFGANGRAMQSRYGGTWILPGTAKVGDQAYLTLVGWSRTGVSIAHITFT